MTWRRPWRLVGEDTANNLLQLVITKQTGAEGPALPVANNGYRGKGGGEEGGAKREPEGL